MSLKLSELKTLHSKGMALIYLEPKKKKPLVTSKGWAQKPFPLWEELENSFEKNYNVGVRLGEPSKLISGKYLGAIDCDVKSKSRKAMVEMNEKLRELGIDLDTAPIVMSGRGNGSKHVYVETVKPMRAMKFASSTYKVKVLMPGEGDKPFSKHEMKTLTPEERAQGYRIRPAWEIAFMGTGQQTVLPPSIHPDTGMKYDWASPLKVKHLPTFMPEKYQLPAKNLPTSSQESANFKAVDVDLYSSRLSVPMIKMIETGEGCEDRSASLLSIAMSMCRAGFTDNEILSVLSNPDHWIAEAAYDHTQSRDRARAVNWLYKYTLLKARYETDIARRFENKPVFEKPSKKEVAELGKRISDETNERLPDLDGNGKPKASLRNVVHILDHFLDGPLVGYDEFANRPFFLKDTPYGGVKGKEVTDRDDLQLQHYIACHYRFEPSTENCFKAHVLLAHRNAYHPVRRYLSALEWDGVPRLDGWLIEAFGARGPAEYLNAVSRKVLVAAVMRVFEPGCKFDYVLVLEGFQGKGKSMALGSLAGQAWFTDSLGEILHKDVVDQMTGKWIIELAELASVSKSDVESVKAFISRQVDRVRPPYGRRSMDFPRQGIFIGSTNNSEYFNDETGNRRFWPVVVTCVKRKWLASVKDQLWAEAVVRYQLGETVYLTPELEKIANREQEKRYRTEWEVVVKRFLEARTGGAPITTTDVWREIENVPMGHPGDYEAKRIGKILRRLKYKRTTRRIDGVLAKCWVEVRGE